MKLQLALIPVSLLLVACSQAADTPSQIAEKYWQAVKDGDTETAQQLLSKKSTPLFNKHIEPFKQNPINAFVVDNSSTSVTTIINPEAKSPGDGTIFDTRLVLEDNQWKIDLKNTTVPHQPDTEKKLKELSDKLSKSIQQNAESFGDVINEGMGILNDVIEEGSEEMGRSMLDAMKELNDQMNESIEKLKQRRQQEQAPAATPDSDKDEGLI